MLESEVRGDERGFLGPNFTVCLHLVFAFLDKRGKRASSIGPKKRLWRGGEQDKSRIL